MGWAGQGSTARGGGGGPSGAGKRGGSRQDTVHWAGGCRGTLGKLYNQDGMHFLACAVIQKSPEIQTRQRKEPSQPT